MLSDTALRAVDHTLTFGCFIKLFPYKWNSRTKQLSLPTRKQWYHIWLFNCHLLYMLVLGVICWIRFLIFIKIKDVPAQVRVLHLIWALGYVLTLFCFFQFNQKKTEIMHFGNLLFKYILESRKDLKQKIFWREDHKDTISIYAIVSTILLFVNPPIHAVAVIHMPCIPSFVSSLHFACWTVYENDTTFMEKLPWVFAENMVVTNFLFAWSFSWILIYLGQAWIKLELQKASDKVKLCGLMTRIDPEPICRKSRELQYIMSMLNDALQYYLQWFPSILLGIAALNLYGAIRLWHIPILTYLNFPVCGLRCLFESMTPLAISGDVNQESHEMRQKWKIATTKTAQRAQFSRKYRWLTRFQASCPIIKCTAGSLYAFENSIVVTTVHNCAQLTLNLLLVYK